VNILVAVEMVEGGVLSRPGKLEDAYFAAVG
jgi:hypothetical protein